jgi:hypothetical protein
MKSYKQEKQQNKPKKTPLKPAQINPIDSSKQNEVCRKQ